MIHDIVQWSKIHKYITNLTKTAISPVDTTNQCREKCIPNLCVHEIYLDNLNNKAQHISQMNSFLNGRREVKTHQNYWSPKWNNNTNVVTPWKLSINNTQKINPKYNIGNFRINTMRKKLVPLECPNWFSHYIFGWLYQRLDLQQDSKEMNESSSRWLSTRTILNTQTNG